MKQRKFSIFLAAMLCAGSLFVAPVYGQTQDSSNSDDWQFFGNINGWLPAIKGQTTTGAEIDIELDEILEDLHFTAMVGFEMKKDKLSLMVDVLYMNLSENPNEPVGPPILGQTLVDAGLKAWVVTPVVAYEVVQSDRWDLDLLAGARYLWVKVDLQIAPLPKVFPTRNAWDGIGGFKGQFKFDQNWFLPFYADVGTGESELTWQAFAGLGYKFAGWDLIAGYRHLEWNFESGDPLGAVLLDLYITGPIISAKFAF